MPHRQEPPSTMKRSAHGRHGPADRAAPRPRGRGRTAAGVDDRASGTHPYAIARRPDVPGRSRLPKEDLVGAVRAETDAARDQ